MSVGIGTIGTTLSRNGQVIAQVGDISGPDLSTDTDEITNHSSPDGVEEFIPTIKRTGEVTFPLVFLMDDPTHDASTGVVGAWQDRSLDEYELRYPDETGTPGAGGGWDFSAYVTGVSNSAPVDGHLAADITLRPSGAPVFVPVGS